MLKFSPIKIIPLLAISALLPLSAWAGFFGDHPSYVHAMTDLRTARSLIARPDAPNVVNDDNNAVREIDAALGEIKQAALDDWKDVYNPPPIDTSLNRNGRLNEALKLLSRAHGDISKEEDDKRARGLRNRAVGHLDNAIQFVKIAMGDKRMDDQSFGR